MIDRWYYAHDGNKIGPFSDRQMMDLALAGDILRTDTIWKEGIEKGVLATKVQYLFPAARGGVSPVGIGGPPGTVPSTSRPTASTPASTGLPVAVVSSRPLLSSDENPTQAEWSKGKSAQEAQPGEPSDLDGRPPAEFPDDIQLLPEEGAPAKLGRASPPHQPVMKRKALGVKGVVIVGQDGARVKFRKKCTTCGFEDSCWNTMPITIGSMKVSFFCPKCRKRQGVEMRGSPK